MNYAVLMAILQPKDDISRKELSLKFGEPSMLTNVISEVPSAQIIHNQVQIMPVLESIFHINYEVMVEFGKEVSLVQD